MGLRNKTFDDRDTDHLRYAGGWFLGGSWNASEVPGDPTGTLASTNDATANVTFTFTDPANAFYYYGMKRANGGLYAICIDCDPNNPQFEPIDALGPDDGKQAPSLLFFRNFNDFGVHEVILTNQKDNRNPTGNSQITVDRFEIQVQDDSVPDSTTSAPSFTSSTSSSTSASTSTSPSSSSSQSPPVAAIAGGVIGGLALLAICAIIFLCIQRQKNQRIKADTEASTMANAPNTGSSFSSPYNPSNIPSASLTSPQTSQTSYPSYGVAGTSRKHHTPSTSISTDITRTTQTSSSSVSGSSGSRRPRRETDAGRILEESEYGEGETLPPDYNQVFRRSRSQRNTAVSSPLQVENPDTPASSSVGDLSVSKASQSERRALPAIPQRLKD